MGDGSARYAPLRCSAAASYVPAPTPSALQKGSWLQKAKKPAQVSTRTVRPAGDRALSRHGADCIANRRVGARSRLAWSRGRTLPYSVDHLSTLVPQAPAPRGGPTLALPQPYVPVRRVGEKVLLDIFAGFLHRACLASLPLCTSVVDQSGPALLPWSLHEGSAPNPGYGTVFPGLPKTIQS